MADKMGKQQAPLLPVLVGNKKQQQQAGASPRFPAVLFVSLWGLFNAGAVVLAMAITYTLSFYTKPCDLPSWLFRPVELTEAEDDRTSALLLGFIACSVPQAAAATAALLLAGHRRLLRRALAYAVLAAAVASHCMYAGAVGVYRAADPGYLFLWVSSTAVLFVHAAGDLVGVLALLCGGE